MQQHFGWGISSILWHLMFFVTLMLLLITEQGKTNTNVNFVFKKKILSHECGGAGRQRVMRLLRPADHRDRSKPPIQAPTQPAREENHRQQRMGFGITQSVNTNKNWPLASFVVSYHLQRRTSWPRRPSQPRIQPPVWAVLAEGRCSRQELEGDSVARATSSFMSSFLDILLICATSTYWLKQK